MLGFILTPWLINNSTFIYFEHRPIEETEPIVHEKTPLHMLIPFLPEAWHFSC